MLTLYVLIILLVAAVLYMVSSVFVWFYSFWIRRDLDRNPLCNVSFLNSYFFFIGALLGLTVFFYFGFEELFFFIPNSWGSVNSEGDWSSTKDFISAGFAFFSAIFLLSSLEKINKR